MDYLIEVYRVLDDGMELIFKLSEGDRNITPQSLSSQEVNKYVVDFPDCEDIYKNIATASKNVRERYAGIHTDYENKVMSTAVGIYDDDVAVRLRVKKIDAKEDIALEFEVIEIGKWKNDRWETLNLKDPTEKKRAIRKMNMRLEYLVPMVDNAFRTKMIKR